MTAALAGLPRSASDIASPLDPGHTGLVSVDGRSALVTFKVPGNAASEDQAVVPALRAVAAVQARHPGLIIAEAGDASTDRAANAAVGQDFRKAEVTSVPITLILLIAVFGALIAAGIPLLLAATAVMTAISLLAIPGQWLPVGSSTSEVVLIIGMAVGIDYSLFYLRREREERASGASTGEALRIAAGTSGRAIVVSGLTVMIALAGLFLTGYAVFTGVAIGTIAVVGVAVAGSLTVLPAVLSWLGRWADRGRIPVLGRRRTVARPSRLWAALVRRVVARPVAWGAAAALAMIALAVPGLGMRVGSPADGGFGGHLPVIQTLNRIDQAFPGSPSPAQVVVTGRNLVGPQVQDALGALRARASARGPIRGPITAAPVAGGRALLVAVPLAGNGTDRTSNDALLALRDHVLPQTLGRADGISYAVAGNTAGNYDDIAVLRSRTPLVLGVVAVLAFVLLLIAFRSVAIPLVSILLNLLSVGAAYGLITLIFQDGRLEGLLGFTSYGAIVPWVPLFMFVFLFGLSMDYHVFILSRIRELRGRGAATHEAIVGGIASSAGVVTSAAVIMVAVFSILATLSLIQLKMLGVGLGAAVLIDATVVRGIGVPAALALLGERSWYLPRWLRWLPGRAPGRAVLPSGQRGVCGWAAGRQRLASGGVAGAGRPADGVEVAQRLGVGADQAALAVGQVALKAERLDQGLGPAQVGPGHGGKQMVLDLVVQAAQGEVRQPPAAHVAGGEHLAAQEVGPVVGVQNEHALVVGGEGGAQVQAEQALLDQDEHHGLDRRQHQEHQGEVADGVRGQQGRLQWPVAGGPAGQRADARCMQADRLAEQHREEQVRLVAVDQPGPRPSGASLGIGEGQGVEHDVGIGALGVGMGVVLVVLAHPPAIAEPDAQVAVQDAENVVGPPGAEDLAVPGIMAEEAHLGEHHGQEGRHGQLPPRISHQYEGRPPGGQQSDGRRDLGDVVGRAPLQQSRLLDLPGQLGVLAAARLGPRCTSRRRTDQPGVLAAECLRRR